MVTMVMVPMAGRQAGRHSSNNNNGDEEVVTQMAKRSGDTVQTRVVVVPEEQQFVSAMRSREIERKWNAQAAKTVKCVIAESLLGCRRISMRVSCRSRGSTALMISISCQLQGERCKQRKES